MAKPIKIGKRILNEDDLQHKFTVLDVDFVVRYPSPAEKTKIEMDVVRRLGGQPRDSFSQQFMVDLTIRATLDEVIVHCSDADFDVWETYDRDLLLAAYGEYVNYEARLLKRD